MVDITIFELHLDGSEFTANAPGITGSEAEETDEEESGAPFGLFAIAALVVLVVVALVVKKRGGGDEEPAIGDGE